MIDNIVSIFQMLGYIQGVVNAISVEDKQAELAAATLLELQSKIGDLLEFLKKEGMV